MNAPKLDGARVVTYVAVAALAAAAIRFTPPIEARRPAERLGADRSTPAAAPSLPPAASPTLHTDTAAAAATSSWREAVDTLGRGETLSELLERRGLRGEQAAGIVRALARSDLRNLPRGLRVTLAGTGADSLPSRITLHYAADRLVTLQREGAAWRRHEVRVAPTVDTVAISGTIRSSLYAALDGAAPMLPSRARSELAWALADVFEYRIDMSRDLQRGDGFRVLVEREVVPGAAPRLGRILAASFDLQENEIEAVRFASRGAAGEFFDGTGKSLRAAFLRAPVEFRRISSGFGLRRHPILGVWKKHKGTDYAASQGTPVRAIGDGVVVFAGRKAGYGNVIDVRHRNGYVSRYGHLRGFSRGLRRGAAVAVGQTIGYVGMTGLATAPHLHFEMLMGGVQRDPRAALLQLKGGEPIPGRERLAFDRVRTQLFSSLERRVGGGSRVAVAE